MSTTKDENKNFNGEDFIKPDVIISKLDEYAKKLESNFLGKEQFSSNKMHDKQPNATYIAVKDIQNNQDCAKILRALFRNIQAANGVKSDPNEEIKDFPGIYLFTKKNNNNTFTYLYTGISRTVISRIKGHIYKGDKDTASWAALIAKKNNSKLELELNVHKYKILNEEKKNLLAQLKDEIVIVQKEIISKYYLSFIHVDNNFLMHIAEGYIACKLKCRWNTFETH